MSPSILSKLRCLAKDLGRDKRRKVTDQMTSIAEARAATREEVSKIREAAVQKIEAELTQLIQKAAH